MAITKGQIMGSVWRSLGKTAKQPGFYTPEKMSEAIEEALTYIAVEMMEAGEGWLTKYLYLDTVGGQTSIDLPGNVAMIRQIRYRSGDVYYPLTYDDQSDSYSFVGTAITQNLGYKYRILGRQLVFDPPIGAGGERYLQIECVYFPEAVVADNELIDSQFDPVAVQYLKYKVASILAGSIEKTIITWQALEAQWYEKLKFVLNRRVLSSTRIREFLP